MSVYENLDEQKQFACRVIADHARATAFAIGDGILPGNEGRNYVLRKIMRRAIYHGREHLGFQDLFFHKVCDFVVEQMKDAYPELEIQREFIGKMVRLEEERFGNTLTVGLKKLKEMISSREVPMFFRNELAGLVDTYGLPIDLIYHILAKPNNRIMIGSDSSQVGEEIELLGEFEFRNLITEEIRRFQQNSSIGKTQQAEKINPIYKSLEASVKSNFHGYDMTRVEEAKVIAIVKDDERVEKLAEGDISAK